MSSSDIFKLLGECFNPQTLQAEVERLQGMQEELHGKQYKIAEVDDITEYERIKQSVKTC